MKKSTILRHFQNVSWIPLVIRYDISSSTFWAFFFLGGCGILGPQPGIEPMPPAARSANHWMDRKSLFSLYHTPAAVQMAPIKKKSDRNQKPTARVNCTLIYWHCQSMNNTGIILFFFSMKGDGFQSAIIHAHSFTLNMQHSGCAQGLEGKEKIQVAGPFMFS